MAQKDNSEVIKSLLRTVLAISSRKTSQSVAATAMDALLQQLKTRYDFLKHVQIKDTRYSEDWDPVGVVSDINSVESAEIGKAIYSILRSMNRSLGKSAGHFFIREIQNSLDDEYTTIMRDMGVDLSLMQLEREVEEWEKRLTTKKG